MTCSITESDELLAVNEDDDHGGHGGHVKNPAAVELGRRGGKKRAANMTAEERSESARRAIQARWEREDHFSDEKALKFLGLHLPLER